MALGSVGHRVGRPVLGGAVHVLTGRSLALPVLQRGCPRHTLEARQRQLCHTPQAPKQRVRQGRFGNGFYYYLLLQKYKLADTFTRYYTLRV